MTTSGNAFRNWFNIILLTGFFVGCRYPGAYRLSTPEGHYSLDKPDRVIYLPDALEEISGLSRDSTDSLVCAVGDELGIIYRISLSDGSIRDSILFHPNGDFEGIEYANGSYYVISSKGELFMTVVEPGKRLEVTQQQLGMLPKENLEGLTYSSGTNELLMIAKDENPEARIPGCRQVYSFHPGKDVQGRKLLQLCEPAILEKLDAESGNWRKVISARINRKDGSLKLRPSGMAMLESGHFLILSSSGSWIFCMDREGTVSSLALLRRKQLPQPEGICMLRDGSLLISTEAEGKRPALHLFRLHRVK